MADAGYLLKEHTAMPGEGNLKTLLQNMTPEMHEGVFVFCSMLEDKEIQRHSSRYTYSANAKERLSSYGARKPKLQGFPINLHRE